MCLPISASSFLQSLFLWKNKCRWILDIAVVKEISMQTRTALVRSNFSKGLLRKRCSLNSRKISKKIYVMESDLGKVETDTVMTMLSVMLVKDVFLGKFCENSRNIFLQNTPEKLLLFSAVPVLFSSAN